MTNAMTRRDFLGAASLAAYALARAARGETVALESGPIKLEAFDYEGVRLRPSRWQQQVEAGRNVYAGLSDADILHGFRRSAGLPAPGRPLGGWCGHNSNTVFGQWLSGISRSQLFSAAPR